MPFLSAKKTEEIERPVLDLSAESIRAALQAMVTGAEALGGIERYVEAVKLKSTVFQKAFEGGADRLDVESFKGLCTFMATVRRRVGPWLVEGRFESVAGAIPALFDTAEPVDARLEAFVGRFPEDKSHRWVRDLATELMHNVEPERYPLMNRWVWDEKANTGVLREIWHGEDLDHCTLPVPDGYGTFVMLREELSQFLSENGFFRDILQYVDILCAQVYAQYICEQGGSYLRTDFSAPEDPMQHTRRLLGLDGVKAGSGRTRLKSIDGEAFVIEDAPLLSETKH
jgi:hypothetical protein